MRRRSGFWYLLDAPTQRFGICLSDIGDSAGNVERHVERLADVVRGEIVAVVQPLQEGDVLVLEGEFESQEEEAVLSIEQTFFFVRGRKVLIEDATGENAKPMVELLNSAKA